MNQVPWRRILERAGDEGPGERGASVINLRDHAPDRQQQNRRRPAAAEPPTDLESELQQALNRAQRSERDHGGARAAPQRVSRREAPEMRSAPMLRPDLAMQRQQQLAVPLPPQQKPASGARNFLAISLSAAVIGFALYQVGLQWQEMNDVQQSAGASVVTSPESVATLLASGGIRNTAATVDEARQRAAFDGNRINLGSSAAGAAGTVPVRAATEQQASLDRDIAEASKLMASGNPRLKETAAAGSSGASGADEGMEQTMLRRGHDMVKNGRVESARLVFEHLAGQKSALGAFALAQTYDPKFLDERGIRDVAPNQALAAEWYQRAAELTMATVR